VIEDYALSPRSRERGVFDPAFVRNLVAEHQSGARDHSQRLWSLVNFEMWARQFIDGETTSSAASRRLNLAVGFNPR
jgi:asparagine synthase (glutamine-hydrolysing)